MILERNGRAVAVINHKQLTVGDRVGSYRIVAIIGDTVFYGK